MSVAHSQRGDANARDGERALQACRGVGIGDDSHPGREDRRGDEVPVAERELERTIAFSVLASQRLGTTVV